MAKEELNKRPEKMSYEQLNNLAHQLSEQNAQLRYRLQEVNMENAFTRLEYLFKVLEHGEAFSKEFVDKCAEEIETAITIKPQEEEK